MYSQKISRFWWTKNPRTILYFIREATGIVIALYFISYIFAAWEYGSFRYNDYPKDFGVMAFFGFIAAVIHTLTWFWVTAKITPFSRSLFAHVTIFLFLIALWVGVSAFLIFNFYDFRLWSF